MEKDFIVTLRYQYPSWDTKDGITFEVKAKSKAEAVKQARRQADRDGHVDSIAYGLHWFKAEEVR